MKKALLLSTMSTLLCIAVIHAQNVFNPADPQTRWNSSSALGTATNPNPNIEGLQKWVSVSSNGVSTGSGSFDASGYKAYFINVGGAGGAKMCFRLKFPKSFTNPDSASKQYPLMVFYHGAGEPGCPTNGGIYNNERQLVHGGRFFNDKTNSGAFDGFLLYPQVLAGTNCWSDWGTAPYSPYYDLVIRIIDSLVKYQRVNNDKIIVTGLSNGGATAWSMATTYPRRVAKVAPSAAANGNTNYQDFIHIPIWFASGGKDTNPTLGYASSTYNNIKNQGGDIRWTMYPTLGHDVWGKHWAEPDFFPFMNDAHKANPLIFFQRKDFCPGDPINVKIGVTSGFDAYEWQKDGVTIAKRENNVNTVLDGSSIILYEGNNITIKSFGSYRVRFKRSASGAWSDWSPKPAVIAPKPVTQTPNIAVAGLRSLVLPAPDGSTTVPLQQPEGYFGYQWFNSSNQQISTARVVELPVGNYTANVVEEFGCGSLPSPTFKVIPASGSPKPDPAKNLTAVATSLTSIQLDWSENPNAGQQETGYEIYRSATAGGPYTLINITAPNVVSYLDQGLQSNNTYYYLVRAVSAFGAAANSNEAGVATEVDVAPPTAPSAFTVQATATNYAYVKWNASTDNVGVAKYEIYLNGAKTFTTTGTTYTIANLDSNTVYNMYVKAVDAAGNQSSPSNQVTASTAFSTSNNNGLNYKYYEGTGWVNLPNFNSQTIVKTGTSTGSTVLNITGIRNRNDNYGILFEGYIKVPTSATYTFKLSANDGANLYVGAPYGRPEILNNDGNAGTSTSTKEKAVYLAAGMHPIAIAYYHNTGNGQTLALTWRNNAGMSETNVPLSAYFLNYTITGGSAPTAPSNLKAIGTAHNKIQLTWNDNSNNESGFELVRSTSLTGTYAPVATITGTSYLDSGLTANTIYYYKVRSVGGTGESPFASNYTEANWKLNNDGNNASGGTGRTLSFTNTSFTNTNVKEGSHALNFNGTNAYAQVANSNGGFPSEGNYETRTVALWIRPTTTTNNKRTIIDIGGSTNGIGVRFNGNALQFGSVSNNVRNLQTLSNLSTNANWLGANNWNHLALVYDRNIVRLFLNGVEVSTITGLAYTRIQASSSSYSRFGYSGSSGDNVFAESSGSGDYFLGQMDNIYILNSALVANEVVELRNETYNPSWDTTKVAPAAPAAPTGLTASLLPVNNIKLTWNDASSDETGFEIWRSLGNANNFRLVATIDGGAGATKTYTDSSLFANITYYYKVRAKGVVVPSAYSNNANITTVNSKPVIEDAMDFTMTFGTSYTLPVKAEDIDGDPLVFTAQPLPYFASIQNVSNGVANIVFTPGIADMGAYTIKVIVSDGFNGFDTTAFTMVVNTNAVPVINPISNVTMSEGDAPRKLHLVANDADGNNYMVWYSNNLPSFATLVDSGNGRGSLTLAPSFNASGTYNLTLFADDTYGAYATKEISVTVNEVDPNDKIQINMMNYYGFAPLWNDVDIKAGLFNVGNLRNVKNQVTTVGIQRMNTNLNNRNGGDGSQTGNNSGLFPDAVMHDYLGWGGNDGDDTLRLRVYGLSQNRKYNFVFYASNVCNYCQFTANSATTFKIGNEIAQVKFFNNINGTDTIYQITPNASGEVIITMIGDVAANVGGYLNALVVEAAFDDGSTPAKPLNLAAQDIANTGVKLTWVDKAYNELNYRVYRAAVKAGPYTLLNPGALNADSTNYMDNTTLPYSNYYYFVAGTNKYGEGTHSDTVHIATANNNPVIASLGNIFVKTDGTVNEDFTVTDNAGDVVTVSVVNRPSFITLQSLGGNNYRLVASPTADNVGFSAITIRAVDDKGGESSQTINIGVADKNTRSFYINMGINYEAPAPWTNMLGWANAGMNRTNLRDENNVASNIMIQMNETWGDVNRNGHQTGNNTGVFPDAVLASGIIDGGGSAKTIRFSGLDQTKRYNLVFVGSINEGTDNTMRFAAGAVADTLQARNNTNQTANLNGLIPNGSGEITVSISKIGSSSYLLLNGLQIEEYAAALAPMSPTNMYAEPIDRNSVFLSWSDRLNNENSADGFELQRATDSMFTANVVTTAMVGNTTTRTVTGLNPNTKYWFRVRAKVGSAFTDYSNRVKTITPQSLVYFNFNFSTPEAGFPWNNANSSPSFEEDFTNLRNQSGQPAGLTISIVTPFNGENVAGVNTGNNSGIAPDAVLQSCYWLDNTQVSRMKVSGLNQNKRYRFGFIGSMGDVGWFYGNYTASYTINGRSVYLNSWVNKTKYVYIGDVTPDANGEVMIEFSTTQEGNWGFNSGMIVETYDDVNGGAVPNFVLPGTQEQGQNQIGVVPNKLDDQLADNQQTEISNKVTVKAYPNPFNDFISLDFNNASANNQVRVDIYDLSGKLVYRRGYGQMAAGMNTLRINTNEGAFGSGIYMVTLVVNGKPVAAAKMLRAEKK